MAVLKCKMCGGELSYEQDATICECEYCGSKQTIPVIDDDKKLTLYERANRLRFNCEFDKAAGVYENIVADFPEEAEAYWGLILCKYGIEYVDDPATSEKIPTCHRSSFDCVLHDEDFEMVMENADAISRKLYREEAKKIEEIRKGIIEISGKEEPYDIFICYKETDEDGERTIDSVMAQDIYEELTAKGYRVFFSRISLENKLGVEYEPYIFAALNSAKVMLVFGTDYDYFNAVWVKNEWSRFLKMMTRDKSKHLIPCYKGIDAYDIPKEFARLQAQDLGKVGANQDLIRGIEKIMNPLANSKENVSVNEKNISEVIASVVSKTNSNIKSLLQRGCLALEDGEWKNAAHFFDDVLNQDAQCAEAYLGKLMAKLELHKKNDLANCTAEFEKEKDYQKVIRFSGEELEKDILNYLEKSKKERVYQKALNLMEEKEFVKAENELNKILDYKDSEKKIEECRLEERRLKELIDEIVLFARERVMKNKSQGNINVNEYRLSILEEKLKEEEKIKQDIIDINQSIGEVEGLICDLQEKRKKLSMFQIKKLDTNEKELRKAKDNLSFKLSKKSELKQLLVDNDNDGGIADKIKEYKKNINEEKEKLRNLNKSKISYERAQKELGVKRIKNRCLEKYKAIEYAMMIKKGTMVIGAVSEGDEHSEKVNCETLVLDVEEDKALLLDVRRNNPIKTPFMYQHFEDTWENSMVRIVFNRIQKKYDIPPVKETLTKNDDMIYGEYSGNNTWDKFFSLSIEEVYRYYDFDSKENLFYRIEDMMLRTRNENSVAVVRSGEMYWENPGEYWPVCPAFWIEV